MEIYNIYEEAKDAQILLNEDNSSDLSDAADGAVTGLVTDDKEGADKTVDDLPSGWTQTTYNGFTHVRDANGNIRVRVDPADPKTSFPHKHIYDELGNSLDANGNIVEPNSPDAHIPLDRRIRR